MNVWLGAAFRRPQSSSRWSCNSSHGWGRVKHPPPATPPPIEGQIYRMSSAWSLRNSPSSQPKVACSEDSTHPMELPVGEGQCLRRPHPRATRTLEQTRRPQPRRNSSPRRQNQEGHDGRSRSQSLLSQRLRRSRNRPPTPRESRRSGRVDRAITEASFPNSSLGTYSATLPIGVAIGARTQKPRSWSFKAVRSQAGAWEREQNPSSRGQTSPPCCIAISSSGLISEARIDQV